MSVRARLSEQQRLLGTIEWPRWALHGIPAVVVAIGAVAVWEHTTHAPHSTDPPDSTAPGALLIALSVMPWVVDWLRHMMWPNRGDGGTGLAFAMAVITPLAVVHVGGSWLGIASASTTAPQLSLMILLVMGCVVAACSPAPVVLAVETAVLAVIVGRAMQSDELGTWTIWIIAGVVVGFGGLAMRANFIAMQRLTALQDELARRAVADERRRVAREVHDTVAHTLSVTMLHLTAARLAVERAPDRARDALLEAERQGRAGMSDLRRMVHLLRTDDDGDPPFGPDDAGETPVGPPVATGPVAHASGRTGPAPPTPAPSPTPVMADLPAVERALPTVAELPTLIDRYAVAGLAITLEGDALLHGGPGGRDDPRSDPPIGCVPPAVGLALYRVVQESLTNAARHGCGDAHIRVVIDAHQATLTVRNHCQDTDGEEQGGMGLIGMHERVVGLGGRFSAGPVTGNGFAGSSTTDALSSDRTGDGAEWATTWLVEAHLPIGPTA